MSERHWLSRACSDAGTYSLRLLWTKRIIAYQGWSLATNSKSLLAIADGGALAERRRKALHRDAPPDAAPLPYVLLAVLAAAVVGPSQWSAAASLAIAYIPYVARIVRGSALRERSLPYIEALEVQVPMIARDRDTFLDADELAAWLAQGG